MQQEEKVAKRQSVAWFLSLPLSKFVTPESIKAVLVRFFVPNI